MPKSEPVCTLALSPFKNLRQTPITVEMIDPSPSAGRVLIVDDDRAIREMFRRCLLLGGHDVVVAGGGAEGLQMLGTDPRIGLVLLDLDMPGIDGRRFREIQRSHPVLGDVPTVIVTGAAITDALRADLQATDYVSKPVPRALLLRTVERHLSRGVTAA